MDKLLIKTKGKTIVLKVIDILYCKAAGSYSVITLKDNTEITTSMTLLALKTSLSNAHIIQRVGQSYLANSSEIAVIHHSKKEIEFNNTVKIPFTISIKEIEKNLEITTSQPSQLKG